MKKTLLTALLISGLAVIAGEPSAILDDNGNQLSFRKSQPKRTIIKINQSRFSGSGKEWDEAEVTGSGLFLNFGLFSPSATYLDDEDGDPTLFLGTDYLTEKPKFNLGFNFEIGNYFRFAKIADGKFGIGLRASWLSGCFNKATSESTVNKGSTGNVYRVAQFSPVRVGPQFGIGLTEEMGLDVFYQFGWDYSVLIADIDNPLNPTENVGASVVYAGIANEIGAAFHYKVFTLNIGYWFGKVTAFSYIVDGKDPVEFNQDYDIGKNSINGLKVNLGFKF